MCRNILIDFLELNSHYMALRPVDLDSLCRIRTHLYYHHLFLHFLVSANVYAVCEGLILILA
jgi:hypothetical protein